MEQYQSIFLQRYLCDDEWERFVELDPSLKFIFIHLRVTQRCQFSELLFWSPRNYLSGKWYKLKIIKQPPNQINKILRKISRFNNIFKNYWEHVLTPLALHNEPYKRQFDIISCSVCNSYLCYVCPSHPANNICSIYDYTFQQNIENVLSNFRLHFIGRTYVIECPDFSW